MMGTEDIRVRRVYEDPSPDDGARVLVDRVWPRGMRKDAARLDEWAKDVAPSAGRRPWYHHAPAKFGAFRPRYTAEPGEPGPKDPGDRGLNGRGAADAPDGPAGRDMELQQRLFVLGLEGVEGFQLPLRHVRDILPAAEAEHATAPRQKERGLQVRGRGTGGLVLRDRVQPVGESRVGDQLVQPPDETLTLVFPNPIVDHHASRGRAKMSRAGPASTTLPSFITIISWASARTTRRSWLMKR